MTEDEKKNEYLKEVFGSKRPSKDKIEDALNRAHEIRKFEIGLYWQRSLFFWGFIVAFIASYFAVLSSDTEIDHVYLILIAISLLGVFTSFAWLHIEIGARSWQKNWEYHIDFLEYALGKNLHKTVIGKPKEFRSLASIHKCFIWVIIVFWASYFGIRCIR